MSLHKAESAEGALGGDEISGIVRSALSDFSGARRALLIHPDYTREDFSHLLAPAVWGELAAAGLRRLDTLNAAGTHREMTEAAIEAKLGLDRARMPGLGTLYNHKYEEPDALFPLEPLPASFIEDKTGGHLRIPLPVSVNRLLSGDYDLIISVNGTVPHEALGYSGGTKIYFPGIAGKEVIATLHWAAVLIGIPQIIGNLENPARDIVDAGAERIFEYAGKTPILTLTMVYNKDDQHRVVPKGLYSGQGISGHKEALRAAAALSSRLHIRCVEEPQDVIVQQLPERYDEIWTGGKGSYKVQKPGVLAEGGEVILLAPHITCFHSDPKMDAEIRQIGYHGIDRVLQYVAEHPDFNLNVAAHVINVRGHGRTEGGKEDFPFRVTLATGIPEEQCRAVGLGYRDPASLKPHDFKGPRRLCVPDGGEFLYAAKGEM